MKNITKTKKDKDVKNVIKCPSCKSTNVAQIIYGYMGADYLEEINDDLDSGKKMLGGCCVEDVNCSCNKCGYRFTC